ncbi:MAG: hypothetical protein F4Y84_16245 [Caldilineaceae bacterium SB0665_bin_25]|nr:hypothetical protein [Caldilineaceae bacterium SB0665_bin_25]
MACRAIASVAGPGNVNRDALLFRQIHPSFFVGGRVSSQAFKPFPKDDNRLSVYDGDQITAEDAWRHYVYALKNASAGAMAVTVAECHDQDLRPEHDPDPFPEHAVIDFSGLSKRDIRSAAKKLAECANKRGWQYGPID